MIKYLILDIDGTLTDGGIYYDDNGNETKRFSTKDGTGIIISKAAGITPLVLTGRECAATVKRMTELGVTELHQNVKAKAEWLKQWMAKNGLSKEDMGYIGDDVNDISAMRLCGFVACPSDAIDEVKALSDYISSVPGGSGVVRDVIKKLLKDSGEWDSVINRVYDAGI